MRAEVKEQAEESLSASVVAGGRGRKGGSFQSAGAEEAVIGAEGAGTPPPPPTPHTQQSSWTTLPCPGSHGEAGQQVQRLGQTSQQVSK